MSDRQFNEVNALIAHSKFSLHRCPTCNALAEDTGSGRLVWPESTFYKLFGETYPCDCEVQMTLMRYYLLAHIPEEYWRLNEKDYYGDLDALEKVHNYLDHWAGMHANGIGLEFYSKSQGTGKTMLASLIAKELVKRKFDVYFVPFRSIMNIYTLPYEARKAEEDRLKRDAVLVLDEIVPPISLAQEYHFADKFEELIRDRTNYGRITILTTNLEPDELDTYYPRTYSLLSAHHIRIHVNGKDVRKAGIGDINKELALNGEIRPIS